MLFDLAIMHEHGHLGTLQGRHRKTLFFRKGDPVPAAVKATLTCALVNILFQLGADRVQVIACSIEDDTTKDPTHADTAAMADAAFCSS